MGPGPREGAGRPRQLGSAAAQPCNLRHRSPRSGLDVTGLGLVPGPAPGAGALPAAPALHMCPLPLGGWRPLRTVASQVRPCTLDAPTQNLIVNISRKDVFRDAMTLMNLGEGERSGRVAGAQGWQGLSLLTLPTPAPSDIKKLPQEMLSQLQITQGFAALEKLEEALRAPTDAGHSLNELSSRFYTIIPHNFGRKKPPPIDSFTLLQAKKDMLLVRAGRWAGRRLPNRQTGQGRRGTDGQEGPERRTAMDRPKDRGEGQADGWGRSELVDRQVGWPQSQSHGRERGSRRPSG